MERTEYPAMLATLQPGQAVDVLSDRVRQVGRLNTEIADWLQERRRLEETYSNGLRKLARRNIEGADLGTFAAPWNTLTNSAENLAESHSLLASKIEVDVERPLREFVNSNREMAAMANMQGNLSHISRDVDRAKQKVEKLQSKGDGGKIANATMDLETAQAQWESQAPYVFESLQAADESRWNHLRDVLTQFQTHEVDQVEKHRVSAEQVLNILLNVETADEIKTFALHAVENRPTTQASSAPTMPPPSRSATAASSLGRTTSHASEENNQPLAPLPEKKEKGALKGLKRLGTVMGRRRESKHPQQLQAMSESPERKPKSSPFNSFRGRLGSSKDTPALAPPSEEHRPSSPLRAGSEIMEPPSGRPSQEPRSPSPHRDGFGAGANGFGAAAGAAGAAASIPNGSHQEALASLESTSAAEPERKTVPAIAEPERDNEGYSVPARDVDPITQAQQDAADAGENVPPQFNVNIRNAPIENEEGEDAQAAIASMANKLQMQAPPQRRLGTVRGRREMRNSYIPPPAERQIPEDQPAEPTQPMQPTLAPLATAAPVTAERSIEPTQHEVASPAPASATLPSSPGGGFSPGAVTASTFSPFSPTEPTSPLRPASRPAQLGADLAGDAQSVRSGRSLTSTGSQGAHRHPELHEIGINSSIIETVSARFENGIISTSSLIGEIALAYNPADFSTPFGTETIRLDNFASLEKIAPNPAFITATANKEGEYSLNLGGIAKTQIAFKYQTAGSHHAPLLVSLATKIEPAQTSIIASYSLNPSFPMPAGRETITLSNVVIALSLEGAKASSCLSRPVGTFSREKNLIFWPLGDVTLTVGAQPTKLLARFTTDSEAKSGAVESRWELSGAQNVEGLGSGVNVSVKGENGAGAAGAAEAADPFADEEASASWREARGERKLVSGHYVAK
ncbi:hypothetical protein Q7P37_004942 [Cladosporium fusiforme]